MEGSLVRNRLERAPRALNHGFKNEIDEGDWGILKGESFLR